MRLFGLILALFVASSGCGPSPATTSTQGCSSGMASLLVHEGTIEILCGCQETAGTVGSINQPLTCTVTAPTTVTWLYGMELRQLHQIVSYGTPVFASAPVRDPRMKPAPISHSVSFSVTGTYSFKDAYVPAISGSIVVN